LKRPVVASLIFRPPVGLSNPNTFRAAHDLNCKSSLEHRSLDTVIAQPEKILARIRPDWRRGRSFCCMMEYPERKAGANSQIAVGHPA